MAQTKTRSSSGKRSGANSRSRSGGSTKNRSSSGSRKSSGSSPRRTASTSANGGSTFSNVVSKAKTPLVAGGAALAGLAGGAALASRNGSSSRFSMPKLGGGESVAKALGTAAKELGKAGLKAGELANEVRKTREEMNGK
jgi:hypothetical protein